MNTIKLMILGFVMACTPVREKQPQVEIVAVEIEKQPASMISKTPLSWENHAYEVLNVEGYFPQFTKDSEALVYTSKTYQGLWLYDLTSGSTKQLTDERGAGYLPEVFSDRIVYEVKSDSRAIKSMDLKSGEIIPIDQKHRKMSPSVYQQLLSDRQVIVRSSDDLSQIELIKNGVETSTLTPNGEVNYLYPSLSPDDDLLVYQAAGLGAFVADLDGNVIEELGLIQSPSWMSQTELLYAVIKDDGMEMLSSEVCVYNRRSKMKIELSSAIDEQVENPRANSTGNIIVANTQKGKIYLIKKLKS